MLPQTKQAIGNHRALKEEEQETGEDLCKELYLYLARGERKEGPLQPGFYHHKALYFLEMYQEQRELM